MSERKIDSRAAIAGWYRQACEALTQPPDGHPDQLSPAGIAARIAFADDLLGALNRLIEATGDADESLSFLVLGVAPCLLGNLLASNHDSPCPECFTPTIQRMVSTTLSAFTVAVVERRAEGGEAGRVAH